MPASAFFLKDSLGSAVVKAVPSAVQPPTYTVFTRYAGFCFPDSAVVKAVRSAVQPPTYTVFTRLVGWLVA